MSEREDEKLDERVEKSHLPIDRGWAWVIAFAGSGLFAFVAGNGKSRGIILVELMEIYPDVSVTALLWIFSLAKLCNKCSGPLSGLILAKTSNRTLSMLGVLIMTCSLIIFAYLPRYEYMYPVYGLAFGIGNGMVVMSAYTAYVPYFDKKKALSLGITTGGSGVGGMIVPILLRTLLNNFNFSGAILILAGVCLQTLVLAALLRPISYYERQYMVSDTSSVSTSDELGEELSALQSKLHEVETKDTLKLSSVTKTFLSAPTLQHSSHAEKRLSVSSSIHSLSRQQLAHENDFGGSAVELETDSHSTEAEESLHREVSTENVSFCSKLRRLFTPKSLLIDFAILCYSSGTAATYQSIPPLAKEQGISKDLVATLLTAVGCLEIFAKVGNGLLADRKCMSVCMQVAIYMTINGVCAILCGLIPGVAGIVIMLISMTTVGTTVFMLMPLALGELVGNKRLKKALAINFVYQGLASIITTFGTGSIYEHTGSWRNVFFFIGGFILLAGMIMSIAAFIVHRRRN